MESCSSLLTLTLTLLRHTSCVYSTVLFCVCALYSSAVLAGLSRPSPRPHLHHNSTHSSPFILHPSPFTLHSSLLLPCTVRYCTVRHRRQHHDICLFLSPYFVHLSSLAPLFRRLTVCTVPSVLFILSVLVCTTIFGPSRSRFPAVLSISIVPHQPYQPNQPYRA